ncbi:hypothetical protein NM688_g6670 [Phlebia brevispora]|uniref:Uncharacterized protein n=1 Tax=Phlebia brevispora TaxID=194682 RepID=A0ACC1SDR6_9APHY|nr:hypothetical protein NM688_g6670 [Phlebia brevispora]
MDTLLTSNTTTLCLACSSSLPPRRVHPSASSSKLSSSESDVFLTPCCKRPICPKCLASNPRLARYNPCLHCLGGVAVVGVRTSSSFQNSTKADISAPQNIDGGMHDQDVFILGDEDDDEYLTQKQDMLDAKEGTAGSSSESSTGPSTPPPPYEEFTPEIAPPDIVSSELGGKEYLGPIDGDTKPMQAGAPTKYYIKPRDTLLGISFKYGVDGRLLCRLNGLPPSTLSTTPHLLHTRAFLTLPPSTKRTVPPAPYDKARDNAYKASRARERAQRRLQTLTKETDRRIANAYVAIAEDADGEDGSVPKEALEMAQPEKKVLARDPYTGAESNLEARAISRYLDDDEWEAEEHRAGRDVAIPTFPLFDSKGKSTGSRPWWKLR